MDLQTECVHISVAFILLSRALHLCILTQDSIFVSAMNGLISLNVRLY